MKTNVRKIMINEWKMTNIDWMGYELQKGDIFNYHHIVKKEHGGLLTIDNGAILCGGISSHQYLHVIECKDYDIYIYLNNLLKNINNQREMPNRQQLLAIDSLLRQFEREHCSDRTSKGKLLIKEPYTRRIIKK